MPKEVLCLIGVADRKLIVDATLGLGGHTEAMLEASPTLKVLCIDQDKAAIAMAEKRLARFSTRLKIEHGNFSEIREIVERAGLGQPDAVIADIGVASLPLDNF